MFVTECPDLFYRVVEFASHSDMKNAIEKLDGTDLNGRKLKLYEDRKRKYVTDSHLTSHCKILIDKILTCFSSPQS